MTKKIYYVVCGSAGCFGAPTIIKRVVENIPTLAQANSLQAHYTRNANKGEIFNVDFDWK